MTGTRRPSSFRRGPAGEAEGRPGGDDDRRATSGDLDRRASGNGAIDTLTLAEYRALPPLRRLGYRLYRHPLVLFGLGPSFVYFVQQRFPAGLTGEGWRPWADALGASAGEWTQVIDRLGGYECLALDLPGFGDAADAGRQPRNSGRADRSSTHASRPDCAGQRPDGSGQRPDHRQRDGALRGHQLDAAGEPEDAAADGATTTAAAARAPGDTAAGVGRSDVASQRPDRRREPVDVAA